MISIKSVLIKLFTFISFIQVSLVLGQEFAVAEAQRDKNGILYITDDNLNKIFNLSQSRSFGLVLLFTTNSVDLGCKSCTDFDPEFDLIARSWKLDHPDFVSNVDPNVKLLFAKAVLDSPQNIPNVFKLFKLQQIPKLFYFPPGSNLNNFETIDIPQDSSVERINKVVNWIKTLSKLNSNDFMIHQQIDWTNVFVTCFIIFSTVYIVQKNYNLFLRFVASKWVWGFSSVIFILLMISGYMFTKMRQVPLAGADRNGDIVYFAMNDFQNQFGIETQIVALFYGVIGVLMITLIKIIPTFDSNNKISFNNNNNNNNNNNKTDSVDFKSIKKTRKKNTNSNKNSMDSPYLACILAIVCAILLYSFFAAFTHVYAMKQSYPFTLIKLTSLLGF